MCARTNPWFRGQTLLVLGHGGGGYNLFLNANNRIVIASTGTIGVIIHAPQSQGRANFIWRAGGGGSHPTPLRRGEGCFYGGGGGFWGGVGWHTLALCILICVLCHPILFVAP